MHLSIILCHWPNSFVKFLFMSLSTCLLGYFSLIRINILNILFCQSFHIALSFHTVDGIFLQPNVICSNRYLRLYFQSILSWLQNSHIYASFLLFSFPNIFLKYLLCHLSPYKHIPSGRFFVYAVFRVLF